MKQKQLMRFNVQGKIDYREKTALLRKMRKQIDRELVRLAFETNYIDTPSGRLPRSFDLNRLVNID